MQATSINPTSLAGTLLREFGEPTAAVEAAARHNTPGPLQAEYAAAEQELRAAFGLPPALKREHLLFLDSVREMGQVNMFGASGPLRDLYDELSRDEARKIVAYWMRTFRERHPTTTE